MIIYYHRKTGRIFGCILGRVHSEYELENENLIEPQNVKKEDIKRKIFDLKETIEFEKKTEQNQLSIMNYKVTVGENGEFKSLRKKQPESESLPNSVETIVIDLTQDLDDIKADFKKDTRRCIQQSENLGFREITFKERDLVIQVIKEVEILKDIQFATYLLKTRAPFLDGLLRMYIVEENKEPLAGCVVTVRGDRFIYKFGGVNKKGRELHAGDALIWNLIKDAKELGFKEFDFGGIYADWVDEERKKVNIFKERWGGKKEKTFRKELDKEV